MKESHSPPFEVDFIDRMQPDLAALMRQHARMMNLYQFGDDVLEEANDAMFRHVNSLDQTVRIESGVVRRVEFQDGNVVVCHLASFRSRASCATLSTNRGVPKLFSISN